MSSFGFTDGAYNRATGTLNAFGGLSDHLVREGHPRMVSRDGDREIEDQIAFFVDRYRQQATGRGAFNDVRYWNGAKYGYPGGTRWVRVSSKGTVAVPADPPKSNHGKRRSNDLTYPYNNRNTAAHKRAVQLAPLYGITWEGENFDEDWHWTFWGALGDIITPASGGASKPTTAVPIESEEDEEMPINYINLQGKGGSHRGGTFAIMRSNSGTLFAKRVNFDKFLEGVPTIDNTQLAEWQKTMKFYEL